MNDYKVYAFQGKIFTAYDDANDYIKVMTTDINNTTNSMFSLGYNIERIDEIQTNIFSQTAKYSVPTKIYVFKKIEENKVINVFN